MRVCAWWGTGRTAQRQVWQPAAGKEGEQLFKMPTKGGHVNRPMSLKASIESRLIRKINEARRFSFWDPSSRCICFMDSGKDFHLLFWPIWGKTPFLWFHPIRTFWNRDDPSWKTVPTSQWLPKEEGLEKTIFKVIFAGFFGYFALTNYVMIKIKEILGFAIMNWDWGLAKKKKKIKRDNSGVNPLCIILKALC